MLYSKKIIDAINFSIKTHELDQKQKRKGKDVPYIVHPLTVGIILARAGASEDTVVAGILHDTIEDSVEGHRVTKEMLTEKFGESVANMVMDVTETEEERENLLWVDRKGAAVRRVEHFSHDSLLVKFADTIANVTDIFNEYKVSGDDLFSVFRASKEEVLAHYLDLLDALAKTWPESPLADDVKLLRDALATV
jgi:guanosine-3',5'-bis(diphosphate) 3'-pyrophosphohydrolase